MLHPSKAYILSNKKKNFYIENNLMLLTTRLTTHLENNISRTYIYYPWRHKINKNPYKTTIKTP